MASRPTIGWRDLILAVLGLLVIWWLVSVLLGLPILPSPIMVGVALINEILYGDLLKFSWCWPLVVVLQMAGIARANLPYLSLKEKKKYQFFWASIYFPDLIMSCLLKEGIP